MGNRETEVNGDGETKVLTNSLQSSEPEVNRVLNKVQKLPKDAFGVGAQSIIEQLIYAKIIPRPKKSINQAHLENDTSESSVSHLESWSNWMV